MSGATDIINNFLFTYGAPFVSKLIISTDWPTHHLVTYSLTIRDLYSWIISISWISCESLIPYFISFADLSISCLLLSIRCLPDIPSLARFY